MDTFLRVGSWELITKREEIKFQTVEPRASGNNSQDRALLQEMTTYVQMDFRITLDQ